MTPEERKYYKARNGEKVGPMSYFPLEPGAVIQKSGDSFYWRSNGEATYAMKRAPEWDLIAEWTDGPVRTVTRREVVEGVYGRVAVSGSYGNKLAIAITGPTPDHEVTAWSLTSTELRAAAAVLLELAGALDNG